MCCWKRASHSEASRTALINVREFLKKGGTLYMIEGCCFCVLHFQWILQQKQQHQQQEEGEEEQQQQQQQQQQDCPNCQELLTNQVLYDASATADEPSAARTVCSLSSFFLSVFCHALLNT